MGRRRGCGGRRQGQARAPEPPLPAAACSCACFAAARRPPVLPPGCRKPDVGGNMCTSSSRPPWSMHQFCPCTPLSCPLHLNPAISLGHLQPQVGGLDEVAAGRQREGRGERLGGGGREADASRQGGPAGSRPAMALPPPCAAAAAAATPRLCLLQRCKHALQPLMATAFALPCACSHAHT